MYLNTLRLLGVMERQLIIGVMGSSHGFVYKENVAKAKELGRCIAEAGAILLTGGCGGLPQIALESAVEHGGGVLAISPARNEEEHRSAYNLPVESMCTIIFTGLGDLGRTIINIRTCDLLIFIQGGAGTLAELGQAIGEKKIIGILKESKGISSMARQISKQIKKSKCIIFEKEPRILVKKLIACRRRL